MAVVVRVRSAISHRLTMAPAQTATISSTARTSLFRRVTVGDPRDAVCCVTSVDPKPLVSRSITAAPPVRHLRRRSIPAWVVYAGMCLTQTCAPGILPTNATVAPGG
ncbi:hypothetical protein GCM10009099_27590 [Caenispirillum bisanense]